MQYKLIYDCDLFKLVQKYPKRDAIRIKEAIEDLASNPRPHDAIKLKKHNVYRARCGKYRIVYEIKDKELIVLIVDIDSRQDVYKNL